MLAKKKPKHYTMDNGAFPYVGFSTFENWGSVNKYLYDGYKPIISEGEKDVAMELELIAKENNVDKDKITPEQIYYHFLTFGRGIH